MFNKRAAPALGAQLVHLLRASRRSGCCSRACPVAYALSRLRWRGREAVFLVVLVALMLPPQVTVVPLYVMWAKLHLIGTLWPLILPNWFGDAFAIFLLRQFFLTIPEEYLDAARVDGCGEFRILVDRRAPAGEAGDRRRRAVLGALHVERLLPAAAVRRREPATTGSRRSGSSQFRGAPPGAVEPDDGGDAARDAARDRRSSSSPRRRSSRASTLTGVKG